MTSTTDTQSHIQGSPSFPQLAASLHQSSKQAIDRALADLQANKGSWVSLGPAHRIEILDEILPRLEALGGRWVASSLEAKSVRPGTFAEGEEWAILSAVFTLMHRLRRTLVSILTAPDQELPHEPSVLPNGGAIVRVFPQTRLEGLLFRGVTGEVWLSPVGSPLDLVPPHASDSNASTSPGGVTLVLGAGNVGAIPPADMLNKLFLEDQVVALKVNPVNAYLGPLIEDGFSPLVRRGYLRVIYGGTAEGQYLCNHEMVDAIHMTGSDKTFDSIVFGDGSEANARKRANRPVNRKPISAELGCVSPVIVVPGPWSDHELREQAIQVATWLGSNAGFNCLTPRVLIQHREWKLRNAFLDAIAQVLARVETRAAYYPGADRIHSTFVHDHPQSLQIGHPLPGHLPWTLIPDLDPNSTQDSCFKSEAFCSILGETSLSAPDPAAFLDRVVPFANEVLWGNLSASILVHPRTLQDRGTLGALERAINDLHYGTIGVNFFAGYAYLFMLTPWGAYPGNSLSDIQSGLGYVNNVKLLRNPLKTVYRGSFKKLDPLTVVSSRGHTFGRQLARFQASPRLSLLPGMLSTAIMESIKPGPAA